MEMSLDADLNERVQALADAIALGLQSEPDNAMQLGVDLLVAGCKGQAVVALASVSPGLRWIDVEPHARAALEEIGIRVPDDGSAGWALARYWARQRKHGGPQTYRWAAALWGLFWTLRNPPEILALVEAMDAWEETLPTEREPIETELQLMAQPIIVASERALAALE